jgi:hypothetical protein
MREWTLAIGVCLFIGALVFKIARVAQIFKHYMKRELAHKANSKMWMQYGLTVATVVIALIVFTSLAPSYVHNDLNVHLHESEVFCESNMDTPRTWFLIMVHAFLIIYGLYVIYESEKQKVDKRFDETKFMSIALYNTTVLAVIIIFLQALDIDVNVISILKSMGLFISSTVSLTFAVVPRALSELKVRGLSGLSGSTTLSKTASKGNGSRTSKNSRLESLKHRIAASRSRDISRKKMKKHENQLRNRSSLRSPLSRSARIHSVGSPISGAFGLSPKKGPREQTASSPTQILHLMQDTPQLAVKTNKSPVLDAPGQTALVDETKEQAAVEVVEVVR